MFFCFNLYLFLEGQSKKCLSTKFRITCLRLFSSVSSAASVVKLFSVKTILIRTQPASIF